MNSPKQKVRPLTPDDVKDVVGDLDDVKVAEILATGATPEELEEAAAWASGESDLMGGELERPLSGAVARVYEILVADEEFPEERP